ncbi:unnamed protein product, partial [Mesorhabditis spiculigera]
MAWKVLAWMRRKFQKRERKRLVVIQTVPDADVEVPLICQMPYEVQQRILDAIGPDKLESLFELACACRSTWQMVENRRKGQLRVNVYVSPEGAVNFEPVPFARVWGKNRGMPVASREAVKLLLAGQQVESIRIDENEVESLMPWIQGNTSLTLYARTLTLELAQKMKPPGKKFEELGFQQYEDTDEFVEFCRVNAKYLVLGKPRRLLVDCMPFKNSLIDLRIGTRSHREVIPYICAMVDEWRRGQRRIHCLAISKDDDDEDDDVHRMANIFGHLFEREDGRHLQLHDWGSVIELYDPEVVPYERVEPE